MASDQKQGLKIFKAVFGEVSWMPPKWLVSIKTGIKQPCSRMVARYTSLKHHHPRRFWTFHMLSVLLIACGSGGIIWYKILPKPVRYTFYVNNPSATPMEKDAKPYPARIIFNNSVAQLKQVGQEISQGIQLSPGLEGTWKWESDRQLVFTPKEDWPVGQEFDVAFAKTLFPEHILLKKYEHRFQSASFQTELAKKEFYQDPRDPKNKKILATLRFSHPVDPASLEKRIQVQMKEEKKKKDFGYRVTYNEFKSEAYIHTNTVTIPLQDAEMIVTVQKGIRSAKGGPPTKEEIAFQVGIPGVYNFFRLEKASLTHAYNKLLEAEQVLVFEMTDGVLSQDFQKNLEAYLLPLDRPPLLEGGEVEKNYRWQSPSEVGPEVLDAAAPLKLEAIPTDKEYSTLHSFKFEAEEDRYLYLKLKKGISSHGGYILAKEHDKILKVPPLPKEAKILHEGAVLSLAGKRTITVVSRGVPALHFEIGRVLPNQVNHLVSQTAGNFDHPDFHYYKFDRDNITERYTEIRELADSASKKPQYSAFDFTDYLKGASDHGLFFVTVSGYRPEEKKFIGSQDHRFILVTDLGLLVKDSPHGTHDVFVQSIDQGRPVTGATVEVLGKNGLPIATKKTDDQGHALIPSLKDFKRDKEPTVYVVRKGKDLSFLTYDRRDRDLNFSRFDIGGIGTSSYGKERLDAFLFSDRGIYRPGETFHIGIIVKTSDWSKKLADIPLEIVVSDARGLEVQREKIFLSGQAFEEIAYQTEETSPTGIYRVDAYVVKDDDKRSWLGETSVRVEEFLPDRMKITSALSLEREKGWVLPENLKGRVTLKNLFGTPAANRRVAGYILLRPQMAFEFQEYRDYIFTDPFKEENKISERLKDQTTNEEGECEFDLDLKRFGKAAYHLTFTAEGYEAAGGRSVVSQSSTLVSPLEFLVGFKPDGDLRYIRKESERSVHLVAVDPALSKIASSGLTFDFVELQYVSVLTKQESGVYKYESVRKETRRAKKPLAIPADGLLYELPTKDAGDFALIVRDENDTELNRIEFSVVGEADLGRSLEKHAELTIKLNKTDFNPAEEIEVSIKAPYTGSGLLTIERDRVFAFKWFQTKTTGSVQTIRVPNDLEGNAYINVSFVRSLDSKEIYMSPLSYGVAPFTVSRARRIHPIQISAPDTAKPGEPFPIKYKGAHPAKAIIFAVDEGILQVAKYQTPKPLDHFFRKRALEMTTAQILDLILPEFVSEQFLSAAGGGEAEALGANLNPFKRKKLKPAIFWSGIIDLDSKERELVYHIPDHFNGTLRVMAVAVSPSTIGVDEKKSFIRGDLIMSPNVPTFVAPGDTFEVSVAVTNNVKNSGEAALVTLALATSEHVQILEEANKKINVPEGKEKTARFKVKANDILGSGRFTFSALLDNKKSQYTIDLSVRPATPYVTTLTSGFVKKGTKDVPVTREMYPHHRKLEASASMVPLGLAHGLIHFLKEFPYGCTEQIVSQAVPALLLRNRPDFGFEPEKAEANLGRTIRILQARQNEEGAFGFWAANSHVDNFQSVYALHFLTEAKESGYPVPIRLLEKGLGFLKNLSNQVPASLAKARNQAYAIYILTRNGIVTTNELTVLIESLEKEYPKTWKKDLSGLYVAATYQLLQKESQAQDIIAKVSATAVSTTDHHASCEPFDHNSQYLYIVARHFPENLKRFTGGQIMQILQPLMEGHYNTITSAYTIMALDAYMDAVPEAELAKVSVSEILPGGQSKLLLLPEGTFPAASFSEQAEKIRFEGKAEQSIFYQMTEAGFDRNLPENQIKDKLEVYREYRNEEGSEIDKTEVGANVDVHLKFRSIQESGCQNIAIVDLLPGGFEVDIEASRNSETGWIPEHVEIRGDRVILYGFVGSSTQEYVYRVRATNAGTYQVPPTFGEAMYNRSVKARTLGGQMVVTERE
ncbi:MAG: alpha-2-macroglobulin [Deltaproteobacteria bacterium]|nr:alpha-2-macroglobulin [Deltaproteobacteria bacterium]